MTTMATARPLHAVRLADRAPRAAHGPATAGGPTGGTWWRRAAVGGARAENHAPREALLVLLASAAGYTALGHWLVTEARVVGFTTLERAFRALVVVDEPARSAAALRDDPSPLLTLLAAPGAALAPVGAVPVVSALGGALLLTALHALLVRSGLGRALRLLLLLAVALNPLVVLYAANGDGLLVPVALVTAAVAGVAAWYRTGELRPLLGAGLALALGALAAPAVLLVAGVLAATAALALRSAGAPAVQQRSAALAVLAPTLGLLVAWLTLGLALWGRPVGWLAAIGAAPHPALAEPATTGSLLDVAAGVLVLGAPAALVVLVLLVHRRVARGDVLALGIAVVVVLAAALPALGSTLGLDGSPTLRDAVAPLALAAAGLAWWARDSTPSGTARRGLVALALLLAALPLTWVAMDGRSAQVLEQPFVRAVETRQSQEGTLTTGGYAVGYASEDAMGRFIAENVSRPGSVLADERTSFAVVLSTGAPDLFLDRLDDLAGWAGAAADPAAAGVDYLLVSTDPADRLARLHPDALTGDDVVLRTPRYVLVAASDVATSPTGVEAR